MLTKNLDTKVSPPPVILFLLKKQYLPAAVSKGVKESEAVERNDDIMIEKLEQFKKQTSMLVPENFLSFLSFTSEEIEKIDEETVGQRKCKSWFTYKKRFISASKCKSIVTCQTTLEESNVKLVTSIAKSIVSNYQLKNHSREPPKP